MSDPHTDLMQLRALLYLLVGLVCLFVLTQLTVLERGTGRAPSVRRRVRLGVAGLLLALVIALAPTYHRAVTA